MATHVHHTDASALSRSFVGTVSQSSDNTSSGTKKLRAKFVESDKGQMATYIKDLEKTIQINKELLAELLSTSKLDVLHKKALEKLNQENQHLQQQLKKSMKDRDDAQAKLLIAEQMLESCNEKEHDLAAECDTKMEEIQGELDRKEFDLQKAEHNLNAAMELLRKFESKDADVKSFLKTLREQDETPQKISDLITEKEELGKELAAAKKKIVELEMNQHDLVTLNNQLKLSINEIKVFGGKGSALNAGSKPAVPVLDFSKIKRIGDKPIIPEAGYVHKLEESIKFLSRRVQELEGENRDLLQKNMQLQNSNVNLLKLNTTLSNSIQSMKEQVVAAQKKRPVSPNRAGGVLPVDAAKRLISTSSAAMKASRNNTINASAIHFRQVTDYTAQRDIKVGHKKVNSSFVEVLEDPTLELKRGKVMNGPEKESESGTGEKDQSFGETLGECEKNVNAGGERKVNE